MRFLKIVPTSWRIAVAGSKEERAIEGRLDCLMATLKRGNIGLENCRLAEEDLQRTIEKYRGSFRNYFVGRFNNVLVEDSLVGGYGLRAETFS